MKYQSIIFYLRGMATMLLFASLALNIYMIQTLKADPLSYKTASLERMDALVK